MAVKMTKNIKYILIIGILILLIKVDDVHAKDVWSVGTAYRVTPTDNMVTIKNYTIKAIDFPAPVRGIRTINGSIEPDRPVVPFASFELYEDIINNTNPIDKFSLGTGDEYITSDNEIRIALSNIPGSTSQNWVYEYYDPWAEITIQKRGLPSFGMGISIDINEDTIDPGDKFKMTINISNTGEDIIKNIDFHVEDPSAMLMRSKYENTLDHLDKDEEKQMLDITLEAPKIIDEKEYEIYVNITGYDIKDVEYFFNTSKKIKVRNALQLLSFNKTISRDSIYLKEYETVVLNIINSGNIYMTNVQIHDLLLNQTIYIRNKNTTEFSLNESSIGPGEAWSFVYILKPLEPGIYILPKFKSFFSMLGQDFEATSTEAGFRVFGPRVVLDKTAKRNDEENDLIEVNVVAKNIGNGFAKVVIDDKLPEKVSFISGRLNLTTSLDSGTEKVMSYIVRIPQDMVDEINETNKINITSWPPAKVTYYLDDYVFVTFSNQTYVPYDKLVWSIESPSEKEIIKKIEKEKEKEREKDEEEIATTPVATVPIEDNQKRVVATIPARTPVKTPEKSTPGFIFYDTGILIAILILLGKNKKIKYGKINKK